jgi:type I restriction enzyme, R subunit
VEAGWDRALYAINEQRTFTDGRIVFVGGKARRGRQKRADFILRYRSDFPSAVVEAKSKYKQAADGLQQAREYAEILGLKFAYSTNRHQIVEIDYTTGIEREVSCYPSPEELWTRLSATEHMTAEIKDHLLSPTISDKSKPLRYYQEIAVNRAVQAVLRGRRFESSLPDHYLRGAQIILPFMSLLVK